MCVVNDDKRIMWIFDKKISIMRRNEGISCRNGDNGDGDTITDR